MFGSDSFPLGPNGEYPKQRISSYGNEIATPMSVEEVYGLSGSAKLPVQERDFHSTLNKVKGRMKQGKPHKHSGAAENEYRELNRFRPAYASRLSLTNPYRIEDHSYGAKKKYGKSLSGADNDGDEDDMSNEGLSGRKRKLSAKYLFERGYKPKF